MRLQRLEDVCIRAIQIAAQHSPLVRVIILQIEETFFFCISHFTGTRFVQLKRFFFFISYNTVLPGFEYYEKFKIILFAAAPPYVYILGRLRNKLHPLSAVTPVYVYQKNKKTFFSSNGQLKKENILFSPPEYFLQ